MEATPRQQRRHDERWQREMLEGLARIHAVLHDVSDGIQNLIKLADSVEQRDVRPPPEDIGEPALLSIDDLAGYLGVSASTVRGLRSTSKGPTVTKLGN